MLPFSDLYAILASWRNILLQLWCCLTSLLQLNSAKLLLTYHVQKNSEWNFGVGVTLMELCYIDVTLKLISNFFLSEIKLKWSRFNLLFDCTTTGENLHFVVYFLRFCFSSRSYTHMYKRILWQWNTYFVTNMNAFLFGIAVISGAFCYDVILDNRLHDWKPTNVSTITSCLKS